MEWIAGAHPKTDSVVEDALKSRKKNMSDVYERSLELHRKLRGKISTHVKQPVTGRDDLSLLYTPGVAEPCRKIAEDKSRVYEYTGRGNLVAVISDGSAVLGLGNIGPEAGMPVMEGKSLLFKEFGGIDSVPLCLSSQDPEVLIQAISVLEPSFGGINLEDISAPRCFQIEKALKERMNIPVFHDDQHGTAIVCLAGLMNAARLTGRSVESITCVINGAGAAGTAIANILLTWGIKDLVVCDKNGALVSSDDTLNPAMQELASRTNPAGLTGSLKDILPGRDVFIGVSAPGLVTGEMVSQMASKAIIFAMANPVPEIMPEVAVAAGAAVVASGRSDYPNQVNNVLAFPGVFRGALDVGATAITEGMKLAAASAIAGLVSEDELSEGKVIPSPLDPRVARAVAIACAEQAVLEGVARYPMTGDALYKFIEEHLPVR